MAKYRRKVLGRNAYLAITSDRQVLHGLMYLVTDEMDDAALVVWLRCELDRVDPVKRRHLQLVSRTVTAAIDGPSPTHPNVARVDAAAGDMATLIASYPEGHIMRGVCERLSQALGQIS